MRTSQEPPTLHLRLAVSREALDLYHACYQAIIAGKPLVRPPDPPPDERAGETK